MMMTIDLQLPAPACRSHHTGTAAGAGLPPGFRFHPTDEELLLHYLGKRAAAAPCPAPVIAEVDIYKYNPWELPAMAVFGESDGEWYFFSPRDRKYPNGVRPNRAAGSGYWKATGTDKPISISDSETQQTTVLLGVKKALVFYRGRPPKGTKTSWIMHEYRLANAASSSYTSNMKQQLASSSSSSSSSASMRLDEWVLCRIYKKKEANQQLQHYINMMDDDNDDEQNLQVQVQQQAQSHRMPRPPSISDYLLDIDYSDDLPPSTHHTPSLNLGFTAVNEQGNNNKRHKTMEEYYSISISTAEMLHASSTSNNKSTQINFSSIFEPPPPAAAGHQLMPSHNDDTSI